MPQPEKAAGAKTRLLLSPADNPLVRAVGRVPAGVHAKLLVAFVGTSLLVVAVALLGLRLLGQSNERVETLGTLQERAFAYGKLRSDALNVRLLQSENVEGDFPKVVLGGRARSAAGRLAVDRAIANAVAQIPPSTFPDRLNFAPPPGDERFLRSIREKGGQLSEVMQRIIDFEGRPPEGLTGPGPRGWPSTSISSPPSSRTPRPRAPPA